MGDITLASRGRPADGISPISKCGRMPTELKGNPMFTGEIAGKMSMNKEQVTGCYARHRTVGTDINRVAHGMLDCKGKRFVLYWVDGDEGKAILKIHEVCGQRFINHHIKDIVLPMLDELGDDEFDEVMDFLYDKDVVDWKTLYGQHMWGE